MGTPSKPASSSSLGLTYTRFVSLSLSDLSPTHPLLCTAPDTALVQRLICPRGPLYLPAASVILFLKQNHAPFVLTLFRRLTTTFQIKCKYSNLIHTPKSGIQIIKQPAQFFLNVTGHQPNKTNSGHRAGVGSSRPPAGPDINSVVVELQGSPRVLPREVAGLPEASQGLGSVAIFQPIQRDTLF